MSRFLFTTLGSLGDLYPYIAIARELINRGHQVMLVTTEDYRDVAEKAGIEFVAIPPSMDELGDRGQLLTRLFDVWKGPEYLMRDIVMPYLHPVYERLLQAAERADLLISHPLTVTLPLVAECRKLPWVSTVLSPMSFMSCHEPPVIPAATWLRKLRRVGVTPYRLIFNLMKWNVRGWEAPLRQFRRRSGFAPSRHMAMFEGQFSPRLNLALFDPPLAQPQPDWPANTLICGSPLFDGVAENDPAMDELDQFLTAGDPPIVFALGSSAVWIAGDFWQKAIAAAQQLGRRAILLTGPTLPGNLPDNARAYSYIPYSRVFPHAAAVIHQAGIGTLAHALRAGRPQLIVPVAFDQPDNADRAGKLGVARALPFRKVTADRLVSELDILLSDRLCAEKARRIADELKPINGAARAADELILCVK